MVDTEYISIAEFAEKAGVSKQAIYKQIGNENSQIAPYVLRDGKKILIRVSALKELYGVEVVETTFTTRNQPDTTRIVENTTQQTTTDNPAFQPSSTSNNPEFQPVSTDYIEFLKAQLAEVKAERDSIESRLNATIAEKDSIIKEQSAEMAKLAQKIAQIADNAIMTTSQQQYLTAKATGEQQDTAPADEPPIVEQEQPQPKRSLWDRLLGRK